MKDCSLVRLEIAVLVAGLLVIAAAASGCGGGGALSPAVAAADQSSPIIPTQAPPPPTTAADPLPTPNGQTPPTVATMPPPLPYITSTGPVFHLVPPIPRTDGHNYDGGKYVTLAEAEAALELPIRLPSLTWLSDGAIAQTADIQGRPAAEVRQEWEAAGITFLGPPLLNNPDDDVWFVHARGGISCLPGPGTPPPGGVLPTYDNIFSVLDTNGVGMMRGNLTDFNYYTPPLGDLIYSESW